MASVLQSPYIMYAAGGVMVVVASLYALKKTIKSRAARKKAEKRSQYPRDTVILHQFFRGPHAPNMSPFPIKLETFLRMAKIPYQNEFGYDMSTKGKTPWITYNGKDVADSQFCIEFLKKELGKDANTHLTAEQRAIAKAMQKLAEECTYWVLALERWVYNTDNYKFVKVALPQIPTWLFKRASSNLMKQTHAQGYGRHSKEEVYDICKVELKCLSDFLGSKPFLMGDQPCEEDCAVFGILSQMMWHLPNTKTERIFHGFKNLVDYCERMKDQFWPDWEECNTAGGTKSATK